VDRAKAHGAGLTRGIYFTVRKLNLIELFTCLVKTRSLRDEGKQLSKPLYLSFDEHNTIHSISRKIKGQNNHFG
jgi:hypothetical protein